MNTTTVHTVGFLAAIQTQMLGIRSCLLNLIAYIILKKYCVLQSSNECEGGNKESVPEGNIANCHFTKVSSLAPNYSEVNRTQCRTTLNPQTAVA